MAATGPTAWNNPDAFVGRVTLSAYEPYPMLTGSSVSSMAAGSAAVVRWVQPQPLAFKNIVMQASLNAGVPAATSQASTGSLGWSYANTINLFSRNGYDSGSSQLNFITSNSFGITASLGYSSTSQQFGLSWLTDTTGGIGSLTTTSNAAGWSAYLSGPFNYSVPFAPTVLTAGEYFAVFSGSTTTATSNSNVTLGSFSTLQVSGQFAPAAAIFGQSSTNVSNLGPNANVGAAVTLTTNGTMAVSALAGGVRNPWFAMSNA